MSNIRKIRGTVEVGGYVFVLDMNALATLEEETGKGAFEVLRNMETGNVSIRELRAFYYACLKREHPEITIQEAGDVFSDHPDAMDQILLAAFPVQEADEGNAPKKPTKK